MNTKSFKKIADILNKDDGISILAIVVLMVIMSVMGTVFTSIMGGWKVSAPITINSTKAEYLAETAAMCALQDAQYRFYGGSFNFGTSTAVPYVVYSSSTEEANYWFEKPDVADDVITGTNDDVVDDDNDDSSDPSLYSIIATGKVKIGSATIAKRQIKVKADISPSPSNTAAPGVHTDGGIEGTGPPNNSHFDMDNPTTGTNVTYGNGVSLPTPHTSGSEAGIVYRPAVVLDENIFKAMAIDQGHYHPGDFPASDNYPNSSYYYSGSVPNVTYVTGNLTVNGNMEIFGVYWINGNTTVFNGNYRVNGIIICEGDLTMNGGGNKSPNLNGGIIQYGVSSRLTGNGQPVDIDINEDYFDALNATMPIITVVSWEEAVSAK